ncbi:hypothetical protein HWV63_15865, partial [Acinetobacter baumannii]|nr:hypothetical protein [Acinetobacter baumannii]
NELVQDNCQQNLPLHIAPGKNNRLMKQGVIKQVREEMQGYDLMLLNLELKQLEIEKLREGEGDEDPTPVKVTIQVVDASKKDAEHQSDTECTSG